MKTRFFFLLLTAMLLSVGAFAQSGNGEPLKGDVNGDDVVDVADVVAVLQIMKEGEGIGERHYYFSIGTTPVTASNYKIANDATQVTSYESQYEYTPSETAFVYILVSDKWWVESIVDQTSGEPINYSEVSDGSISGYNVYKTDIEISDEILVNIEPITYYWYVGTTLPNETNIENIATETLTAKPTTWTACNPKSIAATNNTGSSTYIYYCFPTDWNVVILDGDGGSEVQLADVSTFTYNNIAYTVKRTGRTISNGTTKSYYAKC